ncbi:MAG: tRNA uridine-5-carboxymethylaminomethyl(34) synthesis GTPase MnmE [Planctomycetota bacterium]
MAADPHAVVAGRTGGGGSPSGDVIWAVASPRGAAVRGVIRVSGEGAWDVVASMLGPASALPRKRGVAWVAVPVLGHEVHGMALVMRAPRSFTGEDTVELHLPGSPVLLAEVGARLAAAGARGAAPGEFTRRGFENGRLSLAEAEAVLDLIHAEDADAARRAAAVLGGGIDRSLAAVRSGILDARALLEAGLDFEEGETGEVPVEVWQRPVRAAMRRLEELVGEQTVGAGASDLVLLGPANAGKSSLCNALLGRCELLVSDIAGTTRDVLEVELPDGVRLLDAPGDLVSGVSDIDAAALDLRSRLVGSASGCIVVLDASRPDPALPALDGLEPVCIVWTHIDLVDGAPRFVPPSVEGSADGLPAFGVDALRGTGVAELRDFLRARAVSGRNACGVRVTDALRRGLAALGAACGALLPELGAAELDLALGCLDEVAGDSTPEDVLDRIFGQFCLGK